MIEKEDMFCRLLEVCPSFLPEWDGLTAEWQDEPELPHYLALSTLARHLIAMLERDDAEGLRAVFAVVEEWHLQGDPYVKEAATIGLLEDLQNTNLHKGKTRPDEFVKFLLPETRFWWFKVADFWEKGKLITDDRQD